MIKIDCCPHSVLSPIYSSYLNGLLTRYLIANGKEEAVNPYPFCYLTFRTASGESGELATPNNTFLSTLFSNTNFYEIVELN